MLRKGRGCGAGLQGPTAGRKQAARNKPCSHGTETNDVEPANNAKAKNARGKRQLRGPGTTGGEILAPPQILKRRILSGPGEPSTKPTNQSTGRRSKGSEGDARPAAGKKADLCLGSDGFYEVRVDYGHCVKIAEGCGLGPNDVINIVTEDNQERIQMQMEIDQQNNEQETELALGKEPEEDPMRFEPDPGDELGSDVEL